MTDNHVNGAMRSDLHQIKDDIRELKEDLGPSVAKLQTSVDNLTVAVNTLAYRFSDWIEAAKSLIPLTFVRTLFLWIFFMVAGMFFGVEAIKWFFKVYLVQP